MFHRRKSHADESGFTLVELVTVMILVSIVGITFYLGFKTSISQSYTLQKQGTKFSELASSSQRLANVLRGTTDFISIADNDVTVYAYFYPNNAYVSQIRYYLNAQNDAVLADVTPMTGNPPAGTALPDQKKTYTIVSSYYKASGVNLFTYLDASGNALALPVSDQHIIKGMKVILTAPGSETASSGTQSMTLSISLRNRKTNL